MAHDRYLRQVEIMSKQTDEMRRVVVDLILSVLDRLAELVTLRTLPDNEDGCGNLTGSVDQSGTACSKLRYDSGVPQSFLSVRPTTARPSCRSHWLPSSQRRPADVSMRVGQ